MTFAVVKVNFYSTGTLAYTAQLRNENTWWRLNTMLGSTSNEILERYTQCAEKVTQCIRS